MAQKVYEYYTTSNAPFAFYTLGSTNHFAQTFKIGAVGIDESFVLQQVQVKLCSNNLSLLSGTNIIVEIRKVSGTSPSSEILATGTISGANIISGAYTVATYKTCDNFDRFITLNSSGAYAISLQADGMTAAKSYRWVGDASNDLYWGSSYSDQGTEGKTWSEIFGLGGDNMYDFNFRIYGEKWNGTLCIYEDVINKSGSGANTTAKSVTNVSNYVQQAESMVNARTRKNWTDAYSSLNADVKYILNEVVSDLAAIKVIQYDMNRYDGGSLEAERMINNLRINAERLIEVLRDENIQSFITRA